MRLHELAYCCRAYASLEAYDQATVELRDATGATVDPGEDGHLAALFEWLRRWGCRQFKIEHEPRASESVTSWWSAHRQRLPDPAETLDELGDDALQAIAGAYDDLRTRPASTQERATGPVLISFGPAGAAKALYAIRPNACSPWDEPIRRRFELPAGGDGYRRHLLRIREELTEAVADLGPGGDASQLPVLLDRPDSSPVKLVDEHDWARYSRGFEPPSSDILRTWAEWATRSDAGCPQ